MAFALSGTPQYGSAPGHEFRYLNGLHDIVVSASIKTFQAIAQCPARGQYHDRHAMFVAARRQEVEATSIWQTDIDDGDIISCKRERLARFLQRGGHIHCEARAPEPVAEGVSQGFMIFHEECSHSGHVRVSSIYRMPDKGIELVLRARRQPDPRNGKCNRGLPQIPLF
jgi:hypothetical protein